MKTDSSGAAVSERVRRGVNWAQSLPRLFEGRCSICKIDGADDWLEAICEVWLDGSAPNLTWTAMNREFKREFRTRTYYASLQNHIIQHMPQLWERLVKHGKIKG